jgi:DNA-binding response OmpR family regulator
MSKLIMVVNDTQEILEMFELILTEEGYRVSLHSYEVRNLDSVKQVKPDLLIVDQMIGNENPGWQLIQKMKMDRYTADIPILVCTAAVTVVHELQGRLKEKNIGIVLKPFDIDELINAVKLALKERVATDQPVKK